MTQDQHDPAEALLAGSLDMQGKVVLITGAARGIGAACAETVAAAGASLVVTDSDKAHCDELAARLRGRGATVESLPLDVRDEGQWQAVMQSTIDAMCRLDCLVNNAGIEIIKPVTEISVDDVDRLLAINVRGVLLGCKHAVPHLSATQGSIVNLASVAGLIGWPLLSLYCASKGAVVQLSKALAQELRPAGIRVNALCPAVIGSDMGKRFIDAYQEGHGIPMGEVLEARQGRLGTVQEVADAVLFLASSASRFVNGAALPLDNGLSAG